MNYIIVTSSGPFYHEKLVDKLIVSESVGGVATAFRSLLEKNGGQWICWGKGSADGKFLNEEVHNYTIKRIILTKNEKKGYYDNYSNGALWPLFHYFRENIKFIPNAFKIYSEVNKKYADRIFETLNKESIIWLNDYQMTMVPYYLREKGVENQIIFTWHIPWISPEFFYILPEAKTIMESISKSNIITFHTKIYQKNFIDTYEFIFKQKLKSKTYAIPLGIDTEYFSYKRGKKINSTNIVNKKIIFSIDRLDYTKGLINRIIAIERLLKKHPEYSEKFVYIMNVTPSRVNVDQYIKMKREVEMTIGKVNGEYGNMGWTPIIYMYRKIKNKTLISYYKTADIALITPLIDGLNLVSKEFISVTRRGVLILSKFAGSASELQDALLVNPYDIDEIVEAIVKAFNMTDEERYSRLESLKKDVYIKNSSWWYKKIISKIK